MVYIDESVSFTMQSFDSQVYKEAGGGLEYSFDAFEVINMSN